MNTTYNPRAWALILGVAAAGGALLGWRMFEVNRLRVEVDARRLAAETRMTLPESPALADGPDGDPVRIDHEIENARRAVAALEKQLQARPASASTTTAVDARLAAGARLASGEWQNRGHATPEAALETILWAAAGGDVETLAGSAVLYGAGAEKAAAELFASLPESERQRFGSPKRLLATVAIPEVPTGAVEIQAWSAADPPQPTRFVSADFISRDGAKKTSTIMLVRQDDGWRIAVTRSSVARYARLVRGSP